MPNLILVLLVGFLFSVSARAEAGQSVDLWTRAPGLYAHGADPGKLNQKKMEFSEQSLSIVKRFDFQYGESRYYRGLELNSIVESYSPAAHLDLAILHFSNGIAIPVALTPKIGARVGLDVFVAHQTRTAAKAAWQSEFPEVAKQDETFRYKDPNPIRFAGNKVVVKTGFHPDVTSKKYSPWLHAGSLESIEFAEREAYYRQFSVDDSSINMGMEVWKGRCQYCHGVNKVGSSFGWDFVEPVPVWKLKSAAHLYNKLKYPYHDALERGLMMPTQTDVTEAEVETLWRWIKGISKSGIKSYKP